MSDFMFDDNISYNPIIGTNMPIYYTYTKKKQLIVYKFKWGKNELYK